MRDVFVGALCAIALFMFYYCGHDKWDNWVGHAAGFFAIGVALFPTTEFGPSNLIGKIHFACAALLFIPINESKVYWGPYIPESRGGQHVRP